MWAHRILYENGLLDDVFGKPKEYTKEEALKDADNYKSLDQIRVNNYRLWKFLRDNDLFKDAKPTDARFRRAKTVEEAWEVSLYYRNVADLSNHAKKAYYLLRDAGLLKKRYPNSFSKAVLQYGLDGKFIQEWPSAIDAARGLHMKINAGIGEVCKGKKKTAGGFIWKYKEE